MCTVPGARCRQRSQRTWHGTSIPSQQLSKQRTISATVFVPASDGDLGRVQVRLTTSLLANFRQRSGGLFFTLFDFIRCAVVEKNLWHRDACIAVLEVFENRHQKTRRHRSTVQ